MKYIIIVFICLPLLSSCQNRPSEANRLDTIINGIRFMEQKTIAINENSDTALFYKLFAIDESSSGMSSDLKDTLIYLVSINELSKEKVVIDRFLTCNHLSKLLSSDRNKLGNLNKNWLRGCFTPLSQFKGEQIGGKLERRNSEAFIYIDFGEFDFDKVNYEDSGRLSQDGDTLIWSFYDKEGKVLKIKSDRQNRDFIEDILFMRSNR